MRNLLLILLFLGTGAQAQIKKNEIEKDKKENHFRKYKNTKAKKYRTKNFRSEEEKKIIDLSQQNDNAYKRDLVRKNTSGRAENFDYEETRSSKNRFYLFI